MGTPSRHGKIEDGFGSGSKSVVVAISRHLTALKKRRGRKLLRVSNDDHSLTASYGPQSICRQHLRRFIDYNQIKQPGRSRQEFGHRRR